MYRYYDRYRLFKPKGNFPEKIKPEQLILRYGSEIQQVFPIFHSLPHSYKINFSRRILAFLNQYEFVVKQQAMLTSEHKVKIAASYIKLTLGFSDFLINSFQHIIVYPTAYYFEELAETHVGHFHPKMKTIMLTLDEFEKGIVNAHDGKDLSLHEFSHALCFEMLKPHTLHPDSDHFRLWYRKIIQWLQVPTNRKRILQDKLIREYVFSHQLESIAVLVEMFFECKEILQSQYPELYYYVGKMLKHPSLKK